MGLARKSLIIGLAAALALAGSGASLLAQGGKGGAPAASNGPAIDGNSFEVSGVEVDVRGNNADAARQGGWRLAQRKGWEKLSRQLTGHVAQISDSTLDSLVSGIVVEQEQLGPTRYIARLGVLFDRGRAAPILGVSGQVVRSPSMLILPILWSGGTGTAFEHNTAWREAWKRFRLGSSTIDYVRLGGTGPDALLLNAAQSTRRGRGWWRAILHQYGASDVLMAEVQLRRDYPGGPIVGTFIASHGPDKQRIGQFSLRVDSADGLDSLLDTGVKRINSLFEAALSQGVLKPDPLLAYRASTVATEETPTDEQGEATPTPEASASSAATATYTVQVETPNNAAFDASEAALRGIPGVRSSATTSVALGGISVMRVSYDGPIGSLRSALEARGWSVQEGAGVLRIRRPGGGNGGGGQSPAPAGGGNGGG
ncbi:heavy-metal-associated domain-containing protein [Sphingomonas sp.]|uniref:heavy-metal-associated domain-containing protein n=1 Tax=Sphingomonas sp. TaxID=28214 RepID=UPI001B07A380|nr:heavy-metal-associated domain-containing protein [Sphingomonas sp.]MBO9711875.1 heavy-metal-associated domain-containing protein [Sphingomonas sp.]